MASDEELAPAQGLSPSNASSEQAERPVAVVLVLGDVGRSPRMQYHSLSLADSGYSVHVVGYRGSKPPQRLMQHECIQLHYLPGVWQLPAGAPRWAFLLYAPFKVLIQVFLLLWLLLVVVPRPAVLFVQNPPAVPSLAVAQLVCIARRSQLVVDWHNYGYTILSLKLGSQHAFVRLSRWYEHRFGRRAAAHLCVTRAMARDLRDRWEVSPAPVVVYDKPPSHFHRLSLAERNDLFARPEIQALFDVLPGGVSAFLPSLDGHVRGPRELQLGKGKAKATSTGPGLTSIQNGRVPSPSIAGSRVALIMSSTSWTEDEDFDMLINAARIYDKSSSSAAAHLFILVTGQGPLREKYEAEFGALRLRRVTFRTAWLAAEDYPRLLGAADLGICLHTSSSGLDLPMKVVDMFGCGLPVCAVDYACIRELVQDGVMGRLFTSGANLAGVLLELFDTMGDERPNQLAALQENVLASRRDSWEDNWQRTVWPLVRLPSS